MLKWFALKTRSTETVEPYSPIKVMGKYDLFFLKKRKVLALMPDAKLVMI